MKHIFIFVFFLPLVVVSSLGAYELQERKLLVRLSPRSTEAWHALPATLDIVGKRPGEWLDVAVFRSDLDELLKLDAGVDVLIEDLEKYQRDRAEQYYSFGEMTSQMQSFANNYPDIASIGVVGMSHQFNFIYVLKISDNVTVDEDEPEMLFTGLHHAREWPTVNITMFMIDSLLTGYGVDSAVTEVVDENEIFIIPCVNPDGYIYCHDQGNDWRKNRHYFPEYDTWGVDLNRNYAGATNGDEHGYWGSIQGSVSHEPWSSVYCGPGPLSENETGAVADFVRARDFVSVVTYHTSGELVMWPWGYTYDDAPDQFVLSSIGTEVASRIETQYGGGTYTPIQASGLYPTTGDMADWVYGSALFARGSNTFAYTIEACASFQPSETYLDQIVRENFDGAMYLMQAADSAHALMTPMVMPPVLEDIDEDHDGDYTVEWTEQNPAAGATMYRIDQMSGYAAVTDEAESGDGLWDMNGWSVTAERYHSGAHSFYSTTQQPNASVSMVSAQPIIVRRNQQLSFWVYYSMENEYDWGFIEVSTDGREWDLLDKVTGTTNFWIEKSYILDGYAGETLYLKFRYVTDDYSQGLGFYVDDIYPVTSFDVIEILSDALQDTFFDLYGVPRGFYFYKVMGYNAERGWGSFCPPVDILVRPGHPLHREGSPGF